MRPESVQLTNQLVQILNDVPVVDRRAARTDPRYVASSWLQSIRLNARNGCDLSFLAIDNPDRVLTPSEDIYILPMAIGLVLNAAVAHAGATGVRSYFTAQGIDISSDEAMTIIPVVERIRARVNQAERETNSPSKLLYAQLKNIGG